MLNLSLIDPKEPAYLFSVQKLFLSFQKQSSRTFAAIKKSYLVPQQHVFQVFHRQLAIWQGIWHIKSPELPARTQV